MEAYYESIGILLLLVVLAITCHKAANAECYYCPPVSCIDHEDCNEGCACVGEYGSVGKCMSVVGS